MCYKLSKFQFQSFENQGLESSIKNRASILYIEMLDSRPQTQILASSLNPQILVCLGRWNTYQDWKQPRVRHLPEPFLQHEGKGIIFLKKGNKKSKKGNTREKLDKNEKKVQK